MIADSSGQAATVWDLGGQPAKDSGKDYKGNHGSVDMNTKKRKPLGSTIEEFIFGTKEEAASPPTPDVVLPAPTPTASLAPETALPAPPPPKAALPTATPPQPAVSAPEPVRIQSKEPSLMSKLQAPDKEATVRVAVDMSETLHRKL